MKRPLSPDVAERARIHKDRAVQLTSKGKIEAAIGEYLEALAVSPSDVFARQRVAALLAQLGRKAEAIAQYRSLVGMWAAEGHLVRAVATCHLILQIEPAHAATLTTLSDLYAKRESPRPPMRMPESLCDALANRDAPPTIDPELLARIPLFSDLAPEEFLSLARAVRRRDVRAGELVVEEGSEGDALFAIAHGKLRVERDGGGAAPRVVAEMTDGEFFGEMSLVSRCPRFASVKATTDAEILELGRAELQRLVVRHPTIGAVLERFHEERLLANVLRASPILRELPPDAHGRLSSLLRLEAYPAGHLLLERARPSAGFFMLLRGECDVFHSIPGGGEHPYPPMREGDVFGEISLLQGSPATATVRTASPCVVLRLPRAAFDDLLLAHEPVRRALYDLATQRLDRTREIMTKDLLDQRLV